MLKRGYISIEIKDELMDGFNQSLKVEKPLFTEGVDDAISIEKYYEFCKGFAAMFGWSEETIAKYFG